MFSRFLFISSTCIIFLVLLFQATEDRKRQQSTKVLLVTVESLRSDMVNLENTPELLQAAAKGYQFNNYRAVSGWTGTNIVSLLSGLTPFESGVHTRGQSVESTLSLPLKQLNKDGYAVAGLQPFMAMDIYQNLGLPVIDTSPDPLLWMAKKKIAGKPFFLWHHYVHTHLPYSSPGPPPFALENLSPETRSRLIKVADQAAIHFDETRFTPKDTPSIQLLQKPAIQEFDRWFKKLWELYTSGGLFRDTILIVTADHGDEHGERQMVGHASTTLAGHLHEEIVRIPLFIWLPPKMEVPHYNSERLCSHIDIMPTLFYLLNKAPPFPFKGTNLFEKNFMAHANSWDGMTSSGGFSEPDPNNIRYFEYSHIQGVWKSRLRVNKNNRSSQNEFHLYNLKKDPLEQIDVADNNPVIAQKHRQHLLPLVKTQELRPVSPVQDPAPQKTDQGAPQWLHPETSGTISYKDLGGHFYLEWSGPAESTYLLEYTAGYGPRAIEGSLEVNGNKKSFGTINKLYWKTWIVPSSPYVLRVKERGGPWSKKITLEAQP